MDDLCKFDAATMRCPRCGYTANRLPTFRVCRTLRETAEQIVEDRATRRIKIKPIPMGDAAAAMLAAVGVTKDRVQRATGMKDCGCTKRQAGLNAVGAGFSAVIERAANSMINAVIPHPATADDVAQVANAIAAQPGTNEGLIRKAAETIG